MQNMQKQQRVISHHTLILTTHQAGHVVAVHLWTSECWPLVSYLGSLSQLLCGQMHLEGERCTEKREKTALMTQEGRKMRDHMHLRCCLLSEELTPGMHPLYIDTVWPCQIVEVVCHCHTQPECLMLQCSACQELYHEQCEDS